MSDKANTVYRDNPCRWLITYQSAPNIVPVTKIIETEPSLWWRQRCKQYQHCILLNTHYIGESL